MKIFRILPWYLLLLIIGLCMTVMSVKEGYTNVKVCTADELTPTSSLTKELKQKPPRAAIVIGQDQMLLNIDEHKKKYPNAEFYIFPSGNASFQYIKTNLCNTVIPHPSVPTAPLVFKKNNRYVYNQTLQRQPYQQATSIPLGTPVRNDSMSTPLSTPMTPVANPMTPASTASGYPATVAT